MDDQTLEWLQTEPPKSVNNRIAPYLRRMAIEQLAKSQDCYVDQYGFYVPNNPHKKPPIVAFYAALAIIAVGVAALMMLRDRDPAKTYSPSRYKTYDDAEDRAFHERYGPRQPGEIKTRKDAIDAILQKLPTIPDAPDPRGDRLGSIGRRMPQWAVQQGD